MNMVALFIRRPDRHHAFGDRAWRWPGLGALFLLPVAPLPNIDLPTIVVSASMAGASPEVMSNTVATPLERHLGAIADVTADDLAQLGGLDPGGAAIRHQPRH